MKYYKSFFVYFVFLGSCKIDIPTPSNCNDGYVSMGNENEVFPDKVFRNAPVSNPSNLAEFAYVAVDGELEGIWKYNLITNQTSLIIEFNVSEVPDWSIKDWLVFGTSGQLYKCKSNGDSLTQLTFTGSNYHPNWSPDGNSIIFTKDDGSPRRNYTIIDANGLFVVELDSTLYSGNSIAWSPDAQKLAFINNTDSKDLIAYINFIEPNKIINLVESNPYNESMIGLPDWFQDSKRILFKVGSDIRQIDIESRKVETLKTGCPYSYQYHTIMADDYTIISNKSISEYDASSNTIYYDYDLVELKPGDIEIVIPY